MSDNTNNESKDYEVRIPTTYVQDNKVDVPVSPQEKSELPPSSSKILIKE